MGNGSFGTQVPHRFVFRFLHWNQESISSLKLSGFENPHVQKGDSTNCPQNAADRIKVYNTGFIKAMQRQIYLFPYVVHINILKKCLEFKIVNKNNWQNLFSNSIRKKKNPETDFRILFAPCMKTGNVTSYKNTILYVSRYGNRRILPFSCSKMTLYI